MGHCVVVFGPKNVVKCPSVVLLFSSTNQLKYHIVLQVTNLTEFHTYRSELVAWETERQRQRVEFTVTEKDPYADMRTIEDPEVIQLLIDLPIDYVSILTNHLFLSSSTTFTLYFFNAF